ncbi:MAG: hypothetical protein ACRC77_12430, partial [Bacteroidales bacterium]
MITFFFILLGVCILLYCYILMLRTRTITIFMACCSFFSIVAFAFAGFEGTTLCAREYKLYSLFSFIIAFFSFVLGYKIIQRKLLLFNYSKITVSDFNRRTIFLIFISFISFYFYAKEYGGIAQTMILGNAIRSNNAGENSLAFLKHLIPVSVAVSVYLFSYMYLDNKKTKIVNRLFLNFLFIVSTLLSIMYMRANDGRLMVGFFVLAFILVVLKYKIEKGGSSIAKLTVIMSFCLFGIWSIIIGSEKLM